VAFTWPNVCSLDLSLLFIVLLGGNFVSGNYELKSKNLKKPKKLFFKLGFSSPALKPEIMKLSHFSDILCSVRVL